MKAVSLPLYKVIAADRFDPVELMEITLPGGSGPSVRLANGGQAITFGGQTYAPCAFSPGRIEERLSSDAGEVPGVSVAIQNVTREMALLLQSRELNSASCLIRVSDRSLVETRDRNWLTISAGEIRNPQLLDRILSFSVVGVLGQLERYIVPKRIFQRKCNYTFGSESCGVNLAASPYTIATSCQAGTTKQYIVVPDSVLAAAGSPADPSDYWAEGYVLMTSGPASLLAAPIQRYQEVNGQKRLYLRYALRADPQVGDSVRIRRGCRKTRPDCQDRQGDVLQFGGYPSVPYGLVRPKEIDRTF